MKIFIKTLKGEQFQLEIAPEELISSVKDKIALEKAELPADRQKLIHAGKVLKDTASLEESGIKENEFLVCMVTKEIAKPKAAAPAPAPVAALTPARVSPIPVSTPAPAPVPVPAAPVQPAAINAEALQQLEDMGFPQDEARAALRAANGNTDLAVEFLMSGIPEQALAAMSAAPPPTPSDNPLDALRQHPQLNQLRTIVQSNPGALSQVLEMIGQQNPQLLALIHSNQEQFLEMMNEPITASTPAPAQAPATAAMPNFGGGPAGGAGSVNPAQLLHMLQALPPAQRSQAAQAMGISPEQLQAFTTLLSTMSPEQLQQLMGNMGGAGGLGGVPPPGANVIRLTDEEMQSVTRLTELGFDQQDAVAAYLACDKNEGLAANLLLEGWTAGEGGAGMDEGGDGGFDGGDDMYS